VTERTLTPPSKGNSQNPSNNIAMSLRTRKNKRNDVNGSHGGKPCGSRPAGSLRCFRSSTSETLTPTLTVGTWNVRTLYQAGKLELLQRELERMRYDIVGIAEVRWPGSGEQLEGRFLYVGEETAHENGVGFMLSRRAQQAMIEYVPVSSRVIVARFRGKPLNISVVQVYAPTADSSNEELEAFYNQVDDGLRKIPHRDVCVVVGDWNAKIGSDNTGWQHVMGQFGVGQRNARGERLLQFAQEKGLYICNTKFPNKLSRKWTWTSPNGQDRNMIDYVMVQKKWYNGIFQCRSFPSADIASDHELVLCNLEIELPRYRPEKTRIKRERWNLSKLKEDSQSAMFAQKVTELMEGEQDQTTNDIDILTDRIYSTLKTAATELLPYQRTPKKPWITQDTLTLIEDRRRAKSGRFYSEEKMSVYRECCKQVKKATKRDKQRWIQQRCAEIEEHHKAGKEREAYKLVRQLTGGFKSRGRAIKDKEGQLLTSPDAIKNRWTEYASELYRKQQQCDYEMIADLKRRSCDEDETDMNNNILREEVAAAVKKLKDNKSPGVDEIPAELIKAGGEDMISALHQLLNCIWEKEQWPTEWTKSILVTIPKKGDLADCANYRTIALISHLSKVLLLIMLQRLKVSLEPHLSEEQGGFRSDRSTVQQILTLRLIAEKYRERSRPVYNCFVDYTKAFDSVWQEGLWAVLQSYRVPCKLVRLLKNLYDNSKLAVLVDKSVGEWFKAEVGSRQGDPISPLAFITLLERVMEKTESSTQSDNIRIHGRIIKDLRFADDVDLISASEGGLQSLVTTLVTDSTDYGLQINKKKTKVMVFKRDMLQVNPIIVVGGEQLETVSEFVYLGALLTSNNDCTPEIKRRINLASQTVGMLKSLWVSGELTTKTKLDLMTSCVLSRLLYAAETWTLKLADKRRLLAFEMRCYRRILKISWRDRVSNVSIRQRLQRHSSVVSIIARRKLQLFGHICRMDDDRLVKTVMLGMVDGDRTRGRPPRRWIDDIIDWCGCTLPAAVHLTVNRTQWNEKIDDVVAGLDGPSGL